MSDGRLKADKDYTSEVDKAIPEAQDLANVSFHFAKTLACTI
jgi:26S proteasome regulatory subunit N5